MGDHDNKNHCYNRNPLEMHAAVIISIWVLLLYCTTCVSGPRDRD